MDRMGRTSRGIVNLTRDTTLACHSEIAASFWSRARGLIGRRALPPDHAFVLYPCSGIHALFLTVALDALYLDCDDHILHIVCLEPWHIGPIIRRSRAVIELPAGTAARSGTAVGDLIAWRKSDDDSAFEGILRQRG